MTSRRTFLTMTAATGAAITILPFASRAQGGGENVFPTDSGEIVVHPIEHASFVMETPVGVIIVDPVGDPSLYADFPDPDLILITHEHGDHFNQETLDAISSARTQMIVNTAVYDMLPEAMRAMTQQMGNGETTDVLGFDVEAVPAYNITEGRLDYHPMGRDNGYILSIDGLRIYIAGDTEGTEEMRALDEIDIAFVPMNLPFTMDATQAADAVAAFAPAYVYPYHYRGRDGGTQDPQEFAQLLGETDAGTEVRIGEWYPNGMG
ncbi:secreted protein [Palleronia aestuarii]|uniref:Secreted protein n=1 Tax=Palleronia aestuarii TaxID=568105 RepID=A0A2W7N8G6_9RHOB|nr:MBL fold metallo-hydrolase [Palleronia aestuarii]PZX16330.1 secreted protein [Palleronia aestuarii]